MNNFIVPVDFSETSKNAARFAAHLTKGLTDAHIILYNVFDKMEAGSDGTPLDTDHEARRSIMDIALESVKTELSGITDVLISCVSEENDNFVASLQNYVRHKNINMIIMGISGATRLEQIFVGSNTLKIVNSKIAPVIIVPPDAVYKGAENVMLVSDFKDVQKTIPEMALKGILNFFKPKLHIVNVDSDHYVELTDEYKSERIVLDKMVAEYNPEYYFIRLYDFMEAINQFVEDKNIDLIITVPKNHSTISHIFKTTHTSKLAYHSHVPIIAVHS